MLIALSTIRIATLVKRNLQELQTFPLKKTLTATKATTLNCKKTCPIHKVTSQKRYKHPARGNLPQRHKNSYLSIMLGLNENE
jgi:hypothetical protein